MLQDFRLKVFVTVAKVGSFTKAAEMLGVSQPAVSQNISELERGLGVKLFQRLRGDNVLTAEGDVFMRYACKLLEISRETEILFSGTDPLAVRIAVSDELYTYLIGPGMDSFCVVHPEVSFERSTVEDCDLHVCLRPIVGTPYDVDDEVIGRLRISSWPAAKEMGDISATHEKFSYFDLLYKPTQAFALTKTCGILKDYFASLL